MTTLRSLLNKDFNINVEYDLLFRDGILDNRNILFTRCTELLKELRLAQTLYKSIHIYISLKNNNSEYTSTQVRDLCESHGLYIYGIVDEAEHNVKNIEFDVTINKNNSDNVLAFFKEDMNYELPWFYERASEKQIMYIRSLYCANDTIVKYCINNICGEMQIERRCDRSDWETIDKFTKIECRIVISMTQKRWEREPNLSKKNKQKPKQRYIDFICSSCVDDIDDYDYYGCDESFFF